MQDYVFPVVTQMLVIYDDVFTKEKIMFMSFTAHQLLNISDATDAY